MLKISKYLNKILDLGINISAKDPRVREDFYRSNLFFSLAAGLLLCILSLIGLLGTDDPLEAGFIVPEINASFVYALIFSVNLVFLILIHQKRQQVPLKISKYGDNLFSVFLESNMLLASLTFYTTEKGSSFFFEYILVTSIIYLVPNSDLWLFLRLACINLISVVIVLNSFHRELAWQDFTDIIFLHIMCGIVNWFRWIAFMQSENQKALLEQKKDEFYGKSRTDELTGLLNRNALREDFDRLVRHTLCVALVDLDSFKQFNDTFGHAYGDDILQFVSHNLRDTFHDQRDRCYRYGGDELLIISTDHNVERFYKKLKQFQKQNYDYKNQEEVHITLSIGYFRGIPNSEKELRALIKIADRYLYQAKSSGKGQIYGSFTETIDMQSFTEHMSILETLQSMDEAAETFGQRKLFQKDWTLAYLDVNRFAELNAEFGYREGQNILEQISRSILKHFPNAVLVNREVDHFVLFCECPMDHFIKNIREVQIESADLESQLAIVLRAGIYHHNATDAPVDFLTGMYNAKYASDLARDVTKSDKYLLIYDEAMHEERVKESFVHHKFHQALEAGQFVPYYQPIVGSLSGTTCGFEALSRWIDPEKGLISPNDYIPYLEKMNEAYALDLYFLERVCQDVHKHRELFRDGIFVNVNLSQTDFEIVNIPEEIDRIIKKYQVPKDVIQFEITESAFANTKLLHQVVTDLKNRGYKVWMDDFGVGESSLSAFHNYQVQGVKLDQSFFADVTNKRTQIIIRSIVDLSHDTGSMMIAEGIENQDQLWFARQCGINYIQGFYYSRPVPLDELLKSPFAGNLTNEHIDYVYQHAADLSLHSTISMQRLNLTVDKPLLYCKAVLELSGELYLLRADDEMVDLLKEDIYTENSKLIFRKDAPITADLKDAMRSLHSTGNITEFPITLAQIRLSGRVSYLTGLPDHSRTIYVLELSDFKMHFIPA
jgi:diguanylate cyclase (GGDEF)-like protein